MSDTPIYSTLNNLRSNNTVRFQMPGHMGRTFYDFDAFLLDFTETFDTGNLYKNHFPISHSGKMCREYFSVPKVFMCTNGSTGAIMASICAANQTGHLIVDRNCHKSVLNAMALLDITPHFLYPKLIEPFGITADIDFCDIEKAIRQTPSATPVIITSPSYYGVMQDVEGIANLCKSHQRRLIVDQAHGAHFNGLGMKNAVQDGAALAVISAHKTLPCLSQGAFILSDGSIADQEILSKLEMFCTSSPSYAIMSSLELCVDYMKKEGNDKYREIAQSICELKLRLEQESGVLVLLQEHGIGVDPLRLTVCMSSTGMDGYAFADNVYKKFNIACEMADRNNCVFIITGCNHAHEIGCLYKVFETFSPKNKDFLPQVFKQNYPVLTEQSDISLRQAFFAKSSICRLDDSVGKVCAKCTIPYPPGVPILYPGEKINSATVEFIKQRWYNDVKEVYVVS